MDINHANLDDFFNLEFSKHPKTRCLCNIGLKRY
jgi:hypothetical protein